MWKNREKKIIFHTDEVIAENQILVDPELIYVGSQSFEDIVSGYPCQIAQLREKYARSSYGFGFTPNSSYLKLFNFRFSEYKMYGIKSHVMMSTDKASTHGCDTEEEHWHALGYKNIFLPFAIVAVGVICAIVSFLVENIMKKIINVHATSEIEKKNTLPRKNGNNTDFVTVEITPLAPRLIIPNKIRRNSV